MTDQPATRHSLLMRKHANDHYPYGRVIVTALLLFLLLVVRMT